MATASFVIMRASCNTPLRWAGNIHHNREAGKILREPVVQLLKLKTQSAVDACAAVLRDGVLHRVTPHFCLLLS